MSRRSLTLSGIWVCWFRTNYRYAILDLSPTGIPMNDTTNPRLQIAETSEAILGDNLIGLQLGNEPDLYASYVSCDIAAYGL